MSTNRYVGRLTATQEKVRSAATDKKDRSGLCAFTFADGRQCRTPRCSGHPHLCYFHAQKEAQALVAKQAGEDISSYFSKHYVSACDLTGALARLFRAVARGEIKPKAAMALAYVGQTLVQALPLAEHEYAESFSSDEWRSAIYSCFHRLSPVSQPASRSTLSSTPATPAASAPEPQPATSKETVPVPPKSSEPTKSSI